MADDKNNNKELLLQEVTREFETSPYTFISNFQGIAVADLSDARRNLAKVARRSLVVKHTIARKIFRSLS